MKIGILGLDNSGKSTILSIVQHRYTSLGALKPTKGIDRKIETIFGKEINLWDYGGQDFYRKRYLESRDDLSGLDLIFYLVDIQAPERFSESAEYLHLLLQQSQGFDQRHLLLLFHKMDVEKRAVLIDHLKTAQEVFKKIVPHAAYMLETSSLDANSIFRAFSLGLREIGLSSAFLKETLAKLNFSSNSIGMAVLGLDWPYLIEADGKDLVFLTNLENLGIDLAKLYEDQQIQSGEIKGKKYLFFKLNVEQDDYFLITAYDRMDVPVEQKLEDLRTQTSSIEELLQSFAW